MAEDFQLSQVRPGQTMKIRERAQYSSQQQAKKYQNTKAKAQALMKKDGSVDHVGAMETNMEDHAFTRRNLAKGFSQSSKENDVIMETQHETNERLETLTQRVDVLLQRVPPQGEMSATVPDHVNQLPNSQRRKWAGKVVQDCYHQQRVWRDEDKAEKAEAKRQKIEERQEKQAIADQKKAEKGAQANLKAANTKFFEGLRIVRAKYSKAVADSTAEHERAKTDESAKEVAHKAAPDDEQLKHDMEAAAAHTIACKQLREAADAALVALSVDQDDQTIAFDRTTKQAKDVFAKRKRLVMQEKADAAKKVSACEKAIERSVNAKKPVSEAVRAQLGDELTAAQTRKTQVDEACDAKLAEIQNMETPPAGSDGDTEC